MEEFVKLVKENPDTQPNVDIIVGPGTEVIAERQNFDSRWFDSHIHFICPQQIEDVYIQDLPQC